jgi:hypothetical protein
MHRNHGVKYALVCGTVLRLETRFAIPEIFECGRWQRI